METQSGARAPLVDPFGRELEEWLRDAPATRTPYLADLVVPPVTGPVQRPAAADLAAADGARPAVTASTPAPATAEPAPAGPEATAHDTAATADPDHDAAAADDRSVTATPVEAPDTARTEPGGPEAPSAFRRRDRARHVAACAPAFPEPPERIALRIEDLAVEVAASSGRSTIERIVLLEDEVRRRDEDLARLAAWEATVAGHDDAEVAAAREFAHTVFADLLADAAAESDRRDRAAARRTAASRTTSDLGGSRRTAGAGGPSQAGGRAAARRAESTSPLVPALAVGAEATTRGRDEPVRPVLSLPAVSPVSASTRPTPLVQPATGPTVVDRAAFAAALTAHVGATASTPVVLSDATAPAADGADAGRSDASDAVAAAGQDRPGWWARLVARLLRLVGRR